MATYVVGDVQGCYDPLRRLLDKLNLDFTQDQLWFAGDLINRGPKSLETLQFIISLGDNARSVLGNHECHFLATARGYKKPHRSDTFSAILASDNVEELIQWVRSRPFFYNDKKLGYSMLHAGVPPQWSMSDVKKHAAELEHVFQGDHLDDFLANMYGSEPSLWTPELSGNERLRFIINCFTRLRYCDLDGRLNLNVKGEPKAQDKNLIPWFKAPNRQTINKKIIFGHWSTLGLHQENNTICVDTGCLWGGQLTAIKLGEPEQFISTDCECTLEPF